jgi:hypothetical protein
VFVVLACAATVAIGLRPGQLDTSSHGVDDLRSFSKRPVLVTIPETRADRTRPVGGWPPVRAVSFSSSASPMAARKTMC